MKTRYKKITKKDIKKNLELSASFAEYTLNHPNVLRNVPRNASIILVSKRFPELSEKNIELAKRNKNVYQAVQGKSVWRIGPLTV